jgi:hypothetical protein
MVPGIVVRYPVWMEIPTTFSFRDGVHANADDLDIGASVLSMLAHRFSLK